LAPSSVNFNVFFWTNPQQANLLATTGRVITGIKLGLDDAKIDIPYPHLVVHLDEQNDPNTSDANSATKSAPAQSLNSHK
jgi:small-conductance mechanosensitive channel